MINTAKIVNCFEDFKKELVWGAVLSFVLIWIIGGFNLSSGCMADTIEHIYASWLISLGKLPYKDFFEHHNPLLWYLFSPIAQFFYRDFMVVYVATFMALCVNVACLFMVYKIALLIYDKASAVFSVLLLFAVPMWRDILTFRPDVFMNLFFLIALYCNIKYLTHPKLKYLIISYCSLVISFAFLQKIAVLGFGFVLANAWLALKDKIKMRDFFIAGFSALGLILLMLAFLWKKGFLEDWFHYNFIFNMQLKKYYGNYESGVPLSLKVSSLLVGIAVVRFLRSSDKGLPIVLPWIMSALSLFLFFPHIQYVFLFMFLAAIILGNVFAKMRSKLVLYMGSTICLIGGLYSMYSFSWEGHNQNYIANIKYVLDNANPDDKVMLLESSNYNLYQPLPDYYWFGMLNASIVDLLNNDKRYFDLMEWIKKEKPRFISCKNLSAIIDTHTAWYFKFFYDRNFLLWQRAAKYSSYKNKVVKRDMAFFKLDEDWIKKHYKKIDELDLWENIK